MAIIERENSTVIIKTATISKEMTVAIIERLWL